MSSTLFRQTVDLVWYCLPTGWQYSFGIVHQLRGPQRCEDRRLCRGHRPLKVGLGRHGSDITVETVVVVCGCVCFLIIGVQRCFTRGGCGELLGEWSSDRWRLAAGSRRSNMAQD